MRACNGTCAYVGPEAKVMLDPAWPTRGVTNPKDWVDMPRLLECATGGAYSWSTATEAKNARKRQAAADAEAVALEVAAAQGSSSKRVVMLSLKDCSSSCCFFLLVFFCSSCSVPLVIAGVGDGGDG